MAKLFYWLSAEEKAEVTVSRAGADTIEGATTISLTTQYKKAVLQSDGTSVWYDLTTNLI